MAKREKILIGLVLAAAVVVLVLKYMDSRPSLTRDTSNQGDLKALDQFVEDQFSIVNESGSRVIDETIIKKAVVNWEHDPFAGSDFIKLLEGSQEKEKANVSVEKKVLIPVVYSGYVKAGKKLLAIINGLEYKKGDIIEGTEYRILSISTEKIVLRSFGSETRTIPLLDIFNPDYQLGN